MKAKLNKQEKLVLQALAREREVNPRTSLLGVDLLTLGAKCGFSPSSRVIYIIDRLKKLGLVSRLSDRNVIITERGLSWLDSSHRSFSVHSTATRTCIWVRGHVIEAVLATVIGGLIVAIITGAWRPW